MDVKLQGLAVARTDFAPARAVPDQVKIDALLLSQSGGIATAKDGEKQRPLVPGFPGAFKELVITGLGQSASRSENRFAIDDKGMLQWKNARPLGHVPYRLTLIAEDGSQFHADVDITPKKTGVSHQGYDELKGLSFVKERPAAPPPPAELQVGLLLLSQSGSIAEAPDGKKAVPLVPGFDGLQSLTVTGLSPSGTRSSNTFQIDDDGKLKWSPAQPLGHQPYRLTLEAKDGTRWQADVDISPKKTGTSHQGYELLTKIKFTRVEARDSAFTDAGASVADALKDGKGAVVDKPTLGTSPIGVFFSNKG